MGDVTKIAEGRWPGILASLGIDDSVISGRNGPCPFCGGRDRFRFSDHEGRGMFFCSQCGSGDGFTFLQRWFGWDFKTAAREVEKVSGHLPAFKPAGPDPSVRLNEVRKHVIPATQCPDVASYLWSRGLECPDTLKAHRQMKYYDAGKLVGHYPAMLGTVENRSGKPVTYHVTYLDNGKKADLNPARKIMKPTENVKGCAIRLYPANEIIGVAEGIETAIAAKMMWSIPVWSVMSTSGMETWFPPEGVKTVYIFGDNDPKFGGQKAAYDLAHKLAVKGFGVEVKLPAVTGADWNDVWRRGDATS